MSDAISGQIETQMKCYAVDKDTPSFMAVKVEVGEKFQIETPAVGGRIVEYPYGELIESSARSEDRHSVVFDVKAVREGRSTIHIPLQPLVEDDEGTGFYESEPYIEIAIIVEAAQGGGA